MRVRARAARRRHAGSPRRSTIGRPAPSEFVYDPVREEAVVPRGQHPPAGRASGHRGGLRHRSGRAHARARAAGGARVLDDALFDDRARCRRGHAFEARVYAEDPARDFAPSPGLVTSVPSPGGRRHRRVDAWIETGLEVTPYYDPHARQGHRARRRPRRRPRPAGRRARPPRRIDGIVTNLGMLRGPLRTTRGRACRGTRHRHPRRRPDDPDPRSTCSRPA